MFKETVLQARGASAAVTGLPSRPSDDTAGDPQADEQASRDPFPVVRVAEACGSRAGGGAAAEARGASRVTGPSGWAQRVSRAAYLGFSAGASSRLMLSFFSPFPHPGPLAC